MATFCIIRKHTRKIRCKNISPQQQKCCLHVCNGKQYRCVCVGVCRWQILNIEYNIIYIYILYHNPETNISVTHTHTHARTHARMWSYNNHGIMNHLHHIYKHRIYIFIYILTYLFVYIYIYTYIYIYMHMMLVYMVQVIHAPVIKFIFLCTSTSTISNRPLRTTILQTGATNRSCFSSSGGDSLQSHRWWKLTTHYSTTDLLP